MCFARTCRLIRVVYVPRRFILTGKTAAGSPEQYPEDPLINYRIAAEVIFGKDRDIYAILSKQL